MLKPERGTVARRLAKLVAAGVIASAMCVPAVALADGTASDYPNVGNSDNAGSTDLYMKLVDNDEYAASNGNIKFSVPARINFGAKATGELMAPEATAAYLQNDSAFGIRAASMKVTPEDRWSFVENAAGVNDGTHNAVSLTIKPDGEADATVSAHAYATKGYLATSPSQQTAWSMTTAALGSEKDGGGTVGIGEDNQVQLAFAGMVNNVDVNLATAQRFGQIQWYVTPGAPESDAHEAHYADGVVTDVTAAGVETAKPAQNGSEG